MLYRCPYEDGHVYVCSKVGWLAHLMPGHGKKSGYALALNHCELASYMHITNPSSNHWSIIKSSPGRKKKNIKYLARGCHTINTLYSDLRPRSNFPWLLKIAFDYILVYFAVLRSRWYFKSIDRGKQLAIRNRVCPFKFLALSLWPRTKIGVQVILKCN